MRRMRTNGANEEGETTIKTMGDDEERRVDVILNETEMYMFQWDVFVS
jgi:hypothetical protein